MDARLILADQHPLEPFLVRSQQFLCRAASFATVWPGPVELWIPGPIVPRSDCLTRAAVNDSPLMIRFGPKIQWNFGRIELHAKALHRAWLRRRVVELARSGQKGVFYFRTLRHAKAVLDLLQKLGQSYAFEPHELFYLSARKRDEFRRLEREILSNAKVLFPITSSLATRLEEEFKLAVPSAVSPLGHTGANFALEAYDPSASPHFLYIGSLHKWKGLDVAFEATKGLGVPFEIVGDGGGLARTKRFCEERGYSHVKFRGSVPPGDVIRCYKPGSICLLPLSNEEIARSFTSPLKLFEYMAAARPIIAGDLPSTREIVRNGEHAFLVAVGDANQWRVAMNDLLRDRGRALQLARNARLLAKSCTWEERAKPLIAKLREVT
jgi:glycosyltransferase involved in cell wall biosynthesis